MGVRVTSIRSKGIDLVLVRTTYFADSKLHITAAHFHSDKNLSVATPKRS